ncbi:single-strand binding protein family [Colletotrichum phormii]|uniref:Single-strand binding protein family n=1 Tax=Colletotrichum phormii TaxID=359342 RepID=A0AAJ0EHE3_9PEZI|nr:single-strand binding protein family [Colletotrichum phormii]KAK1640357.1 single-strand binding protein family [Colletotrichum phormii]
MSASALFRRAAVAPRMTAAARAFTTTRSNNLARITIVGNLADAPEVVPTSTGREIVRYAVASNSGPKDNRQTSWFRVTSFEPEGPRRDFLQSLPKGTLVYIEGDASMRAYQDAEGKNRSSLSVVQRSIDVLRRPQNGGEASE